MDVAMLQNIALRRRLLAAEQRANARDQLPHAEGFRHIIVRSELKSNDAVGLFTSRREHQDGNARVSFVPPELAAYLKSVHSREHEVEDDQVRGFPPHFRQREAAVRHRANAKAFFLQVVTEQFHHVALIFESYDCGTLWGKHTVDEIEAWTVADVPPPPRVAPSCSGVESVTLCGNGAVQ